MSQFIPYAPFEPRGAIWRPLGVSSTTAWALGNPPSASRQKAPFVRSWGSAEAPVEPPAPAGGPAGEEGEPSPGRRDELRATEHAEAMELIEQEREAMKAKVLRLAEATAELEGSTRAMESARRTLEIGARALHAAHATLVEELRAEAGAVIREAARRIAGDALHADPTLLGALVEEAVAALGRDGLQVHVSPVDAEALRERMPGLDVVEDFAIEAGCISVGPAGRIDASLETAMVAVGAAIERWAVGG